MNFLNIFSFYGDHDPSLSLSNEKSTPKNLRKTKSHSALLSPLVRLVREPVASLESAIDSSWIPLGRSGKASEDSQSQSRRQALLCKIKDATDLETWKTAAEELDEIEGNNAWKSDPVSPLYGHEVLRTRIEELEASRIARDPARMLWLFRNYLTRDLCNMGDIRLYKHSHVGTKYLIQDYIETVCNTLEVFLDSYDKSKPYLDSRHVYEELLRTRQYFGRSALMLSGGGTLGMTHSGVIKTLLENNLLPRIISGSSAGSIVASVVCTRTDEELPDTLVEFCHGDLDVFEKEDESSLMHKVVRILTTKNVFDPSHLIRVMQGWLGDITFAEAYNRTRRVLNISVSSTSMNELPRLLNYITAPNVLIWSAVVTSCSVPIVFSPSAIMEKDPQTGEHTVWNPSQQYIDGSVDNDLPMTRLSEMFNVNHFIVSQVNPHVVPFLSNAEVISGPEGMHSADQTFAENGGIWSAFSGIAKSEVLHRMHQLSEFGVFPTTLTKLRSVMSQKYSGDITIVPEVPISMLHRILQNPDTVFMERALLCGERATWPKLSRIQNHLAIELAIDKAISHLSTKIAFSPSQVNLRLLSLQSNQQNQPDQTVISRRRRRRARVKTKSWCATPGEGFNGFSALSSSLYLPLRSTQNSRLQSEIGFSQKLSAYANSRSKDNIDNAESDSDSDEDGSVGFFLDLSSSRTQRRQSGHYPLSVSSTLHGDEGIESNDFETTRSNLGSRTPSPSDIERKSSPGVKTWIPQPPTPYSLSPMSRHKRGVSSPSDLIMSPLALTSVQSLPAEKAMGDAEQQYKRLFHSLGAAGSDAAKANPDTNADTDLSGTRGIVFRKMASALQSRGKSTSKR